ncbi:MAG: TMEM14 family protein [Nodosilinea sp.]
MSIGVLSALIYGVLVAIGGIIGYAQARSQVSLITGLVSGGLLILGGVLWYNGEPGGIGLALGITVALIVVFLSRWMQTRKAMPALAMVAAGILALVGMLLPLL